MTYWRPLLVNGVAFCGVLTVSHVSRLTIGTVGLSTRSCTCVTSSTVRPLKDPDSAM